MPLLLTMAGLGSAAGVLFLGAQLTDVSIWAMNFAMMFAIALGIDYALFLVARFREALAAGADAREATGVAMETAGKAVFTSGLAVFAALMAVALVPSPAFRTVPTIIHHVAEGELFGWTRLMKPAAALMARSERARTLKSLKRSLVSG